tara:strand:- start:950 stop:1393 length:444 start_codon:yes stop_codon:yes gene_type:complete
MSQFWLIKDRRQVKERVAFFQRWLETEWDFSRPIYWEPKVYRDKRTKSQNALSHAWYRELAEQFTAKGHQIDEQEMKKILKNRFLGVEDVVIQNTVIPGQLKETSKLAPGEMMFYLDQVWHWAADLGITLQIPADSEYMKLKGETNE